MQYRTTRRSDVKLSALGYGCMRFTKRGGQVDQEKANRELKRALELGVNYFDTAYVYPGSEVALGNFIQEYDCRDRLYIATKLPHYRVKDAADFDRYFDEELERLQTDHVDFYLMHMLNDAASWLRLVGLGVTEWIAAKKDSGAIRRIGFSFHGGTGAFRTLLDAYDWDFCQIQFNYMDEHAQAGIEGLGYAGDKGIPVIVMEPLRGGSLVNLPPKARKAIEQYPIQRSAADWGLRWIWDHEAVTVVLSGMNDLAQVEENCRIASESLPGALTADELRLYDRILEGIHETMKVPCTGCRYCTPCPQGVDIPNCFASLNNSYADGYVNAFREYLMATTMRRRHSYAGLCVECGACERKCPQHIAIRRELKGVRRRFENPIFAVARRVVGRIMKY